MDSHQSGSPLAVNPWPMGDRDGTPKKSRGSWFSGTPHKAPPLAQNGDDEDLPVLKLTHFTKKVMVCFDTVRTGMSRTRELLVENPCDFPQELRIEKFPFDKGFSISATCWELDGCELMRLPIAWTPKEEGNAREVVTFKCEGAFRLQVILLGTAEDPPKKRGAGRRSTFSVHRKVPLKVTQPQAVLKPSRPTMILKPKGQQKPQAPGKQPRPSTGKASRANQENRAPIRQSDAQKSVIRPMVPAEVENDSERQILPSTPSPRSVCERSTLEEFTALDSSLAEINGDGMPVTAEDLLLENLKRQTLSVCNGMSPLLQTAKPFVLHKPTQANNRVTITEDPHVGDCNEECPNEVMPDEASPKVPKRLSIEAKTTVTKNKAPEEEQPSKPATVRKNLFVSDEAGGNRSSEQMGSSPPEFEDSLNEPRLSHVPNDDENEDQSSNGNVIVEQCTELLEEISPVANHAELSLDFDVHQNKHGSILPVDDHVQSDAPPVVDEPTLDSGTAESSLPLLRDNSAQQLGTDDFKVHTSVVTGSLISRKRVSDPKDKAESPPKKLKTQDAKGHGAKKQPPPPRDRTMNRTLALRKAAAAEKFGNKTAKAKAQGKPAGQYKAKAPMKGVPMAKLNLLKSNATAIPRHPMPFAAKNMFYDERWMEKQERGFTRWLNHVLTPDDCPIDPSCKATKIDAGTLCVEPAGKSTIPPAPSKEDLSLRAYTAKRKLNRLRRGACMLFQSEPIVRVIQKLEAEIEKRRIVVRLDRKLHADYGIKQKLLDLFLSYNPLWLRIGLETTYGEILPIQSNTDVVGLSRFVITRLLGNPDIAAQYAHPTVPHLYGPGYEETLSQFTLKKFLILVFFLDRAKLTRLIDHDPCLFCKDSEFKSSRDILLHFSREYLRGEGDLTRHLSFMGYNVTHRQTALDEFDFSVTKLATDLRCGVRLARIVELLIKDWTLSSQLRVPAISRLQKIHNVEITLKALKLDGGGVDARAIVDGHREKTLELLWRIIFQFQIGLLLNEQQLQEEIAFLRKNLRLQKHLDALSTLPLMDTLAIGVGNGRRDSNEPNVYFKSSRLSLLLKWSQVVCSFYGLKVENFTVAFSDGRALCYLVHHYHPSLLPLGLINQETTQTQYQRQGATPDSGNDDSFDGTWSNVYSPSTGKPGERDRLLANERENFKVLYDKVSELGGVPGVVKSAEMSNTIPDEKVVITYVSYLCARLLDLRIETRAARTIQMVWKAYRLRQLHKRRQAQEAAAQTIQDAVRLFLTRRHHQRLLGSIIKLQAMRRRVIACRQVEALRQAQLEQHRDRAATSIQAYVRGLLARRHYQKTLKTIIIQSALRGYIARKDYLQTRQAVISLQAAVRCRLKRCRFVQMRQAAVVLQQRFRAKHLGSKQRALYSLQRRACISLQAAFRGYACRQMYRKKRLAVIAIQAHIRAHLQRMRYLKMKFAVLVIQRYWQSATYSKSVREEYLSLRQAAIIVQSVYRGMVARRHAAYIRSVVKAQAVVRSFLQRRRFLHQKRTCIVIQKSFRGYAKRRRYEAVRAAALVLQRRFRAQQEGQIQLVKYNIMRGAVITLQAWVRGVLARRWLAVLDKAAVRIQSVWKMHRARNNFLAVQSATWCLQKYTRAYLAGKSTRSHYVKLRASAVLIQSQYRSIMAQRKFGHQKACSIAVQSYVRMYIARKRYRAILQAAVVMQRRFRAKLSRDRQLEIYKLQKSATITLQAWFRGILARQQIAAQHKAAIKIQSVYKAYRERQSFKTLRAATVCLQKHIRAHLIGRHAHIDYLRLKAAAVTVQSSYRGLLARRTFNTQKQAAVKIQSVVRMHQAHSHYLSLREAVMIVQTRYRTQKLAQATFLKYQIMRGACITLQAWTRGFLVRQEMQKLHNAAIVIQKSYRSFAASSKYQRLRDAAVVLQQHWRATKMSREVLEDYVSLKKAAIVLQSAYRGKIGRHIATEHRSARIIQSCFRMHLQQQQYQRKRCAAIKIQTAVRMQQAHSRYIMLRRAALIIQTRYQAKKTGQAVCNQYLTIRRACITLQALTRGYLVRQQMQKLHMAAIQIQKSFRSYSAQTRYQKLRGSVLVLQTHWRATRLSRRIQEDFVILKKAAVVLQSAYRGKLGRNTALRHSSSRIIQSYFRMHLLQQRYQRQKCAAIKIQTAVRMQQAHSRYSMLRQAALVIQTRYQAKKTGQAVCNQYLTFRRACITLQAVTRGYLVRQQMQKLHMAAIQIQKSFRSYSAQTQYQKLRGSVLILQTHWRATRLSRRIQEDFVILKKAAVVLQSAYRGKLGRNTALRHSSARIIQSYFRRHLLQQRYQRQKCAAIKIQTAVRMQQAHSRFVMLRQAALVIQTRYQAKKTGQAVCCQYLAIRRACITLQAVTRGYLVRHQMQKLHMAAIQIQKSFRSYLAQTRYQKLRGAVLILQTHWRATRLSRQIQEDFVTLKKAALVLQAAYRGKLGRNIALSHSSARIIQSYFRMYRNQKQYQNQKSASVRIQSAFRKHQAYRKYTELKRAVIIIQRKYKATKLAEMTCLQYHIHRGACITLQAYVRGFLVRQHIRRLHSAATAIQKNYMAYKTRTRYLKIRDAADVLQKYWRATRIAREQQLMFISLKKAAVTVQSVYRGRIGRKIAREHRAARLIQSEYRMHAAVREYTKLRAAVITIQASYRMQRARQRYHNLVAATQTIQQFFRGYLITRAIRSKFLLARSSTVKLQASYRGFVQRRAYIILKQAATKTQALYRGKREREAYQALKRAAVVLQEKYRAHVLRTQAFRAYNIQRGAAITIQAAYKAYTARQKYIQLKQAVITIQSAYRGHRQRTNFLLMKNAATSLQARYRAHLLMREALQNYQAIRQAAIAIQSFYRAYTERCHFITVKSAATVIQSFFRGNKQRLAYQETRRAAVVLQMRYRTHRLQREATRSYHVKRGAAITIQAYLRGRLARQSVKHIRAAIRIQSHFRMLTQRRRYLALQNAANRIRASFRAQIARRDFLSLRLAALTIQTRYRALMTARHQQREYRLILNAIITIQSFARGKQARKLAKRIRAAVKIQSAYRGHVQQRRYQAVRQTTLFLQARTRGMMARQKFTTMKKKWQAAVRIQQHLRGFVARKALETQRQARLAQLERFSSVARFHLSTIQIQRCYRLYKMRQAAKAKMQSILTIQRWMRASLQRLHFLKLRRGMVALQRRVRQHQAVRQQAAVCIQTQARVWLARQYVKKMKAAALTMQSVWRGLKVRRSCKNKKIAAARARCIKANKAVTEEKKLCNRTTSALDYLLQYRQMSGLLEALISLDVVSRLSAACCERLVEGQAVPVIFTLIKSCNRSLPCMEVIKYSVNILLNLTKYPPTAHAVFEEPESISMILDLMQMYREKGAQIFSKVCTLMGILSQDTRRAQIILSAPKNKERLLGINRLTERKYSLAAKRAQAKARGLNSSTLSNSSFLNTSSLNASRVMHAPTPRKQRQVQPEWVLGRGKMREIADPLEACHFVMETLHLK
ncbi:abnormal spindle-like microcephaly-associated protein homolog [Patiria miniata]|uniref:Calponin-homology (CH) domain-containing protein n=1 Tax=Patiria miniata TaxID=46514 RepID=A0A914AIU5_PATMI|nr:abnormal spindle-like microcephaly-associated protein homolog [Patiria miniata]